MKFITKISPLIFLLICPHLTFGQNTFKDFYSNQCKYKSDGHSKSQGIKMVISMPCQWSEKEGDRPNVVKKYVATLKDNTTIMGLLLIKKNETGYSKSQMKFDISKEGLKSQLSSNQKFISGRTIKIDGIECGELICDQEQTAASTTIYLYNIIYVMYYNNNRILLQYSMGGESKDAYSKYISDATSLFKALAEQTIITSQWE